MITPAGQGVVAVVLAAGLATRFGSAKVLALLDGRPLLVHVLERLATAGVGDAVVVVGDDAAAIESALDGMPARIVRNPDPARGLSSSLVLGVAAARERRPDAIAVALADQPRLDPAVVSALLAAADDPARPLIVPRYSDRANPNPVVMLPAAFDLVREAAGDRGLGPVIARHPELVHEVPVEGANPDVDTPADLAALAAGDETGARRVGHPVG